MVDYEHEDGQIKSRNLQAPMSLGSLNDLALTHPSFAVEEQQAVDF